MKKLLLVLSIISSLLAVPPVVSAKDKDKNKKHDSDDSKEWKILRDRIREIQEQYGRMQNAARDIGGSRAVRQDLADTGGEVDRVSRQFDHGDFDWRDLQGRVSRVEDGLRRIAQQLEYERQHQGGRYYR